MKHNKNHVDKILVPMASFLVDSMMDFEREFETDKDEHYKLWFTKRHRLFESWMDKAVRWDTGIESDIQPDCFFYWLALLPYDATHNTEALILCVQHLVNERIEEMELIAGKSESQLFQLRHLNNLNYGLMTAVTGVPLIN